LAKLQFFIRAIAEVNDDALKTDGGLADANLELPKCSFGTADRNLVMVGVSIDVLIAEMNPLTSLRIERLIETEYQQQNRKDR